MSDPVLARFQPDRATYLRTQSWLAAFAMAGGMLVLWALGNPHVWTGAIGGLAAIALRGWYLASDELTQVWELTRTRLTGPGGRGVDLDQISAINRLGSMVQIVTTGGDKHLIKHQADRDAVIRQIEAARDGDTA